MTTRGRALRLTAVSTLVVLGLTGFSTSRHGHGHGGDGGGGCSSSSQDHDSSSSSSGGGAYKDDDDAYGTGGTGHHDYDDDTYDDDTSGGSGGTTATPEPATAELLTCATKSAPYATVEITNPNDSTYTFPVTVFFKDTVGTTTSDSREETTIPPRTTTKVRVPLDAPTTPDHCELDDPNPRPLS